MTERWFVEDRPIEDAASDAFEARHLADQLEHAITSVTPPATIGLIGGFGTGKTTVANLLRERIAGHTELAAIVVSVEKHTGTPRQRALVYAIGEALERAALVRRDDVGAQLARLERTDSHTAVTAKTDFFTDVFKARTRWYLLVLAAVTLVAWAIGTWIGYEFGDTRPSLWFASLPTAIQWGLFAWVGVYFRDVLKEWTKPGSVTRTVARAEAADEIERVFQDLVFLCQRRLVVIVENLDRLDEADVLDAIGAIRSLRDVPRDRPPIFVVPCDEAIVRRALASRSGDAKTEGTELAAAFVDKWFSLRLHMPPSLPSDMRSWASRIVEPDPVRGQHTGAVRLSQLAQLEPVLDVLLHDGAQSKRHLVKRINGFFAQYRLASIREAGGAITKGEISSHPTVLARLTVLRDDYPSMYRAIEREHALLWALDSAQTGERSGADVEDLVAGLLKKGPDHRWRIENVEHQAALQYLKGTARFGRAPQNLAPFLFFAQPEHSRFIGSEMAADLRRALEDDDAAAVREKLDAAATDAERLSNIVDTVVAAVSEAREGLRLTNAIRAASEIVGGLEHNLARRLANAIALRLADSPESNPPPAQLADVILNTDYAHRDALVELLTTPSTNEQLPEQTELGLAILKVAAANGSVDGRIDEALVAIWRTLEASPKTPDAHRWLERVDILTALANKLAEGIPPEFFVAILRSLGAGDDAERGFEAVSGLLRISAQAKRSPAVLDSVIGCATISNSSMQHSALLLVRELAAPSPKHAAHIVRELSTAFSEAGNAAREDVLFTASLLLEWLPMYADLEIAEEDPGEFYLPSEGVATVLAHAAQVTEGDHAQILEGALRELVRRGKLAESTSLVAAFLERITAGAETNDPVARLFLTSLVDQSAALPEAATAVADFLKNTLTLSHTSSSPEAILALEAIAAIATSGSMSDQVGALANGWIAALPHPQLPANGQWEHLAAALSSAVSAGTASGKVPALFETRLRAYAGSASLRESAMRLLASTVWPTALLAQAATDLGANWESVDETLRSVVARSLAGWDDTALPDGLGGKIVAHIVSSNQCWEDIERLWPRLDPDDRTALVVAGGRRASVSDVIKDAPQNELVACLVSAAQQGRLADVVSVVRESINAPGAAVAVVRAMRDGTELEWSDETATLLVRELYDNTRIASEYAALTDWIGQGAAHTRQAAVVLRTLASRRPPDDPELLAAAVAEAITANQEDALAATLHSAAKDAGFEKGPVRTAWRKRRKGNGFLSSLLPGDTK